MPSPAGHPSGANSVTQALASRPPRAPTRERVQQQLREAVLESSLVDEALASRLPWASVTEHMQQQPREALLESSLVDEGKPPLTPDGPSSSASTTLAADTLREQFTARSRRLSPVGSDWPVRDDAMVDLAVDQAMVWVFSSQHGCIRGRLRAPGIDDEVVEFTLLEIKPGYAVVGNVEIGSEYFKKVCWKLTSVNGRTDVDASACARNDILVFEGPSWATPVRMARQAQQLSSTIVSPPFPAERSGSQTSRLAFDFSFLDEVHESFGPNSFGGLAAPYSNETPGGRSCEEDQTESHEQDLMRFAISSPRCRVTESKLAHGSARKTENHKIPPVPRLNLKSIHEKEEGIQVRMCGPGATMCRGDRPCGAGGECQSGMRNCSFM
eukprot:TRINITY_DN1739_c0_g2_i1.p1 TRINITY_DN1739_c0_g2~~TRINITY_DN1739_c0_g2_i1.p1  ORF type:complete len:399 (-),score=70.75 TRINITY_DN1739_c0_g2_i1:345-1493(-)